MEDAAVAVIFHFVRGIDPALGREGEGIAVCARHFDFDILAGRQIGKALDREAVVRSEAQRLARIARRELQRQMKKQFDAAIRDNRLKPSEGMRLLEEYERGLDEYTYLSF